MIVENIFSDRSDRINFCAEIMHRNFPPPNLCNLRPLLTIMLGRGWLPIPSVEVSRERPLLAEAVRKRKTTRSGGKLHRLSRLSDTDMGNQNVI